MTIQEQRRKAFEECFPLHEDIQWCGESIGYAPKSPSGAYSFVGLMAIAAMANGQLTAWNAALESLEIELPDFPNGRDSTYFAMVEAIERAGLRVKG